MRAVGYRQIAQFVSGACSRPEAEDRALAATRQLAKRQFTWLRRMPAAAFEPSATGLVDAVADHLSGEGLLRA